MQAQQHAQDLLNTINRLPPEKIVVAEDFVEFLGHRNKIDRLVTAASKLSEKSFQKVWDNAEDAEYDTL
ncbi:MAG: hypothetical protein JKY62_05365 [Desulfocapsa sp.]|jgi:hypothetical protein|nr:hypothetical protein [Desulfocapsa sp.]